jgi:hypothetical protein
VRFEIEACGLGLASRDAVSDRDSVVRFCIGVQRRDAWQRESRTDLSDELSAGGS